MTKIKTMNLCAVVAMCMSCAESIGSVFEADGGGKSPDPICEAVEWGRNGGLFSSSPSPNLGDTATYTPALFGGASRNSTTNVGWGWRPTSQASLFPNNSGPFLSPSAASLHMFHMTSAEMEDLRANIIWLGEMRAALELRDKTINGLVDTVAQLQLRLDAVEQQRSSDSEKAGGETSVEKRISGLEKRLGRLKSKTKKQTDQTAAECRGLWENKVAFSTYNEQVQRLQRQIDLQKQRIDTLEQQRTSEKATLEKQVQEKGALIADLQQKLKTFEDMLTGFAADVALLQGQTETLSGQKYVTLEQQKNETKNFLEEIRKVNVRINQVSEGKKGFATVADLKKLSTTVASLRTELSTLSIRQEGCEDAVAEIKESETLLAEQLDLLQKGFQLLQNSVDTLGTASADEGAIRDIGSRLDDIQESFREVMKIHTQELEQKDKTIQFLLEAIWHPHMRGRRDLFDHTMRPASLTTLDLSQGRSTMMFHPTVMHRSSHNQPRLFEMMERSMWGLPINVCMALQMSGNSPWNGCPLTGSDVLLLPPLPREMVTEDELLFQNSKNIPAATFVEKREENSLDETPLFKDSVDDEAPSSGEVSDSECSSDSAFSCSDSDDDDGESLKAEEKESSSSSSKKAKTEDRRDNLPSRISMSIEEGLNGYVDVTDLLTVEKTLPKITGSRQYKPKSHMHKEALLKIAENLKTKIREQMREQHIAPNRLIEKLQQRLQERQAELNKLNPKGEMAKVRVVKGAIRALENEIERVRAEFPEVESKQSSDTSAAAQASERVALLQRRLEVAHRVLTEDSSAKERASTESESDQSVSSWLKGTSADPGKSQNKSKNNQRKKKDTGKKGGKHKKSKK